MRRYPRLTGPSVLRPGIGAGHSWNWRTGHYLNIGFSWDTRDLHRGGFPFLQRVRRVGGNYTYLKLGQGTCPYRDFLCHADLEHGRLEPPSTQAAATCQRVPTLSFYVTAERPVTARLVARSAGLSAIASYRQVVRRGVDACVILGDPDPAIRGHRTRLAANVISVL